MNSVFFAIACLLVILVTYWGSATVEPVWLTRFLGQRSQQTPESQAMGKSSKKKWRGR
jgi:hypothetical protein